MANSIQIKRESRLNFSDLLQIDGVTFWDLDNLPDYQIIGDEFYHFVQSGDRIDLLANRYYGNSALWWVIGWANNLELFPSQLNEGLILTIPSSSFVNRQLIGR
jgi:hypothetical protein